MKKVFGILSSLIIAANIKAQELKTYEGSFEKGYAKYTYIENEKGERIYNGKFEYTTSMKDVSVKNIYGQTLGETASIYQEIGQYTNGKASGEWKMKYYVTAAKGVMDLSKVNLTSAKLIEEIIYHYDGNGILNGNYNYTSYNTTSNGVKENKVNAFIKNGHLVGKYERVDNQYTPALSLTGNFTDEGFFDGDWTYVNTNPDFSVVEKLKLGSGSTVKEVRKYRNGILISYRLFDNAKGTLLKEYNNSETGNSPLSADTKRDSLKLFFNLTAKLQNGDKRQKGFTWGERNYTLYQDYTNIESMDYLQSGLCQAFRFSPISGFVKAYVFSYNLNAEERKLYGKKQQCFDYINSYEEREKRKATKDKPYFFYERFDSLYYYLNGCLSNMFSNDQRELNRNNMGKICFYYVDTIVSNPKDIELLKTQFASTKNIINFYTGDYTTIYKKLISLNRLAGIVRYINRSMPLEKEYKMADSTFRSYNAKLLLLQNRTDTQINEYYKSVLINLRIANYTQCIATMDSASEQLKTLIKGVEYENELIKLITDYWKEPEWNVNHFKEVKASIIKKNFNE